MPDAKQPCRLRECHLWNPPNPIGPASLHRCPRRAATIASSRVQRPAGPNDGVSSPPSFAQRSGYSASSADSASRSTASLCSPPTHPTATCSRHRPRHRRAADVSWRSSVSQASSSSLGVRSASGQVTRSWSHHRQPPSASVSPGYSPTTGSSPGVVVNESVRSSNWGLASHWSLPASAHSPTGRVVSATSARRPAPLQWLSADSPSSAHQRSVAHFGPSTRNDRYESAKTNSPGSQHTCTTRCCNRWCSSNAATTRAG